jgi:hypothetical protein
MKSATSSAATPTTRFRPYPPVILPRPSVMTTRNGARLRAAALSRDRALNDWLVDSITPSSVSRPDWESLNDNNTLCVLFMSVLKVPHRLRLSFKYTDHAQGIAEGIFKDPDVYCLSLVIEAKGCSPSPLLRLARFEGSSSNGDAPLWTRIIQPNTSHYLVEPRSFAAALTCGLSNIPAVSISSVRARLLLSAAEVLLLMFVQGHISARMYHFARQVSVRAPQRQVFSFFKLIDSLALTSRPM